MHISVECWHVRIPALRVHLHVRAVRSYHHALDPCEVYGEMALPVIRISCAKHGSLVP